MSYHVDCALFYFGFDISEIEVSREELDGENACRSLFLYYSIRGEVHPVDKDHGPLEHIYFYKSVY